MDDVKGFTKDLEGLLNRYSAENKSGTPDFMLATYLLGCLAIYEETTLNRDAWHSGETS